MRLRSVIGVVLAVVVIFVAAEAKGRTSPLGSFQVSGTPLAGGTVTFTWQCSGLPQNGGATVGCWIDLLCENALGVNVVNETLPAAENVQGPLPVVFGLPGDTVSCDAYLFYDGYNNPRRRKTNTLAALFFSVS